MSWKKANNTVPEPIKEWWCEEQTAQPVLAQVIHLGRTEMQIAWYENGAWWANDEKISGKVVYWKSIIQEQICPICEGAGVIPTTTNSKKVETCKKCTGIGKMY